MHYLNSFYSDIMVSFSPHVLQLKMISILAIVAMMVAPTLQSQLKILETPEGLTHPDTCTLACAGVGRWSVPG